MSNRLEGRVAAVTGASSGNGRAIAIALAAEGARVVCSDLRPNALAFLHSLTPWPRLGKAGDVAKCAVYLASDDAEWVSGSALAVDGAFTAR